MNKIAIATLFVGFVVGIAMGAILMPGISMKSQNETKEDFSKNLEKAMQEINRLVKMRDPEVSARVKNYTSAGEFFLVEIEFYDKNGTLAVEKYYLSADGKKIASSQAFMSLRLEKIEVSEDDDPWLGAKDAKVVIVEFSDYACPYCAKFALEVEKKVIENYGNITRLVFRDFPLHGEKSIKAAMAANCAKEQGKFWEYHYLLFERQNEWYGNLSKLYDYATELSLNVSSFKECLDSEKYRSEVEKDFNDGLEYGVTGTPTFFINGDVVVGYRSYEEFARLIEEKLK